jgi:chromosome segregation ATPase
VSAALRASPVRARPRYSSADTPAAPSSSFNTAMVEFRSLETLREALAPVEALRGEQSELESWVRESFATLDSLHGELSDWQRDLTRQQALLDQRQAAADDASQHLAHAEEYERRLVAAEEEYRQLVVENAEQLQTLEEVGRKLAVAKSELRLLQQSNEERGSALERERQRATEEHHEWLTELRELRRTMQLHGSLLQRLTGSTHEGNALPDGAATGPAHDAAGQPPLDDDVACRAAELRRRAELRRAAHGRTS